MNIVTHGIIQQASQGLIIVSPGVAELQLQGFAPTLIFYPAYETYISWTLGISGATWSVTFDNNNGHTRTYNASFGSGTSSIRNLRYYNDTLKITVSKTNNGGITQDAVSIFTYKNQGVPLDTKTYTVGENASSYVLNLTGLSPGDVIYVDVNEG